MRINLYILGLLTYLAPDVLIAQGSSLEWNSQTSGPGDAWVTGLALDADDNSYCSGYYSGLETINSNMVTTVLLSQDEYDGYITKYDPLGELLWAISLGGIADQRVNDIDALSNGDIAVCGPMQNAVDFDPSENDQTIITSSPSSFIAMYDSQGNLNWARSISTNQLICQAYALTFDANENVYITGAFTGTVDFDPSAGETSITSTGGSDIFILKLSRDGQFIWAVNMGGTSNDEAYSIATDNEGNVITTGFFSTQADFDPSEDFSVIESKGGTDSYVCKLNSSGELLWAKPTGGTGYDRAHDIAVGPDNEIITTGYFQGTAEFDSGQVPSELTSNGGNDCYVSKWGENGLFQWAKSIGGEFPDHGNSVKIDVLGNALIAGQFWGEVDLDPGVGVDIRNTAEVMDFFILKLDREGNRTMNEVIGGTQTEYYPQIELNSENRIILTGAYSGNCDMAPGSTELISQATGYDVFILSLEQGIVSSTEENLISDDVMISAYPNPTVSSFNLESKDRIKDLRVVISDPLGRIIATTAYSDFISDTIELDGEQGVYIVTLYTTDQVLKTFRLLKRQ